MTTQPKPLTLRDHEVKQLLSGEVLVVRPVKPQPPVDATDVLVWEAPELPASVKAAEGLYCHCPDGLRFLGSCPYSVGSRWWVREKWRPVWLTPRPRTETLTAVQYAADYEFNRNDWGGTVFGEKWESPILLSRAFSRLTLEVVETTVEQQDGEWVWTARVRRVE